MSIGSKFVSTAAEDEAPMDHIMETYSGVDATFRESELNTFLKALDTKGASQQTSSDDDHSGHDHGRRLEDAVTCDDVQQLLSNGVCAYGPAVCQTEYQALAECTWEELSMSALGLACDLTCATPAPSVEGEGDLRLVGGSDQFEGRVEIFHNGEWGTVCVGWDGGDSSRLGDLVCSLLGAAELLGGSGTALDLMSTLGAQGGVIAAGAKFGVAFPFVYHYLGNEGVIRWDIKCKPKPLV